MQCHDSLIRVVRLPQVWIGMIPKRKCSRACSNAGSFLLGGQIMSIYDCVESFSRLLNYEYDITLGRKGKLVILHIVFDKKDCFHLMGLQYLKDFVILKRDRGDIFDDIIEGRITAELLESSIFYPQIRSRIKYLPSLETIFDSNETIFKYNQNRAGYSMIKAEYLLKTPIDEETVFVFIDKNNQGNYFCRSLFMQEERDFSLHQTKWTLLKKVKLNKITSQQEVLYNRLDEDNKDFKIT